MFEFYQPHDAMLGHVVFVPNHLTNDRREQNYFAEHAARMNYRAVAERGWAIGFGPVESACLERQGRFKRSGQSWTPLRLRHLCGLIEARQNGHWDELWQP